MCVYSFASKVWRLLDTTTSLIPVSVNKTLLLREPWPCDPAAETAIQPQIWCFQSWYSNQSFILNISFFTDTGISTDQVCWPRIWCIETYETTSDMRRGLVHKSARGRLDDKCFVPFQTLLLDVCKNAHKAWGQTVAVLSHVLVWFNRDLRWQG